MISRSPVVVENITVSDGFYVAIYSNTFFYPSHHIIDISYAYVLSIYVVLMGKYADKTKFFFRQCIVIGERFSRCISLCLHTIIYFWSENRMLLLLVLLLLLFRILLWSFFFFLCLGRYIREMDIWFFIKYRLRIV